MDPDTLARIRLLTNEPSSTGTFDDDRIAHIYTSNDSSVPATAAEMWEIKAAKSSSLVDVSEGQSSRKMSQVGAAALSMSKMYRAQAADSGSGSTGGRRPAATRPIERA